MNGAPPIICETSRPYWDGLAQGEVHMQRCDNCAAWVFYPRAFCPACGGRHLTWTPVSGPATLYSYTITQVPVAKAFTYLGKPILAVVELANGVRVPTRLVEVEPGEVSIGMALEPVFDSATYENATLLLFKPAGK